MSQIGPRAIVEYTCAGCAYIRCDRESSGESEEWEYFYTCTCPGFTGKRHDYSDETPPTCPFLQTKPTNEAHDAKRGG